LAERLRRPSLTDYFAGAMLANGFVWIWLQALGNLSAIFSKVPVGLLADISFVIYLSGGILSSYIVCGRTSSGHLFVGLKLAALAWVVSLFFMLTAAAEPTMGLALTLLACFAAGGIAGAYLALRSMLRRTRVRKLPPEDTE
jgi:hypothetical protein